MFLYRIRQFIWSVTSKLTEEDRIFMQKHLNKVESELFYKLPVYEQKHSINVARDVKSVYDNPSSFKCDYEKEKLIKAALLHDIGKAEFKLSVIDKGILVILNKVTKGNLKKLTNVKKIDCYYNHGERGYNILKKYGYDEEFLGLIKNHHNKNVHSNAMDILKYCDDKN